MSDYPLRLIVQQDGGLICAPERSLYVMSVLAVSSPLLTAFSFMPNSVWSSVLNFVSFSASPSKHVAAQMAAATIHMILKLCTYTPTTSSFTAGRRVDRNAFEPSAYSFPPAKRSLTLVSLILPSRWSNWLLKIETGMVTPHMAP